MMDEGGPSMFRDRDKRARLVPSSEVYTRNPRTSKYFLLLSRLNIFVAVFSRKWYGSNRGGRRCELWRAMP